ncbi:dTDP-4-amino-4,6-dideoxygalactose transaminase [Brumicola pallidula]|uniref:Lipopolysaccharide biosynthesis protein rffA n=1 Tax=Brumicola pallidula DSM 14239 = ACAM 615 TaxID=1121922 RepID=K6Z115_9ALTE|nr:dTDP-4-amino-4,6-dideoxygalactose transaminase [Glaciecola pallidula]GAC29861.1 lipopolysaccharide biosynthesis protein rffA [Glaciecola pallidula DSM 14239 = ACAM 615]
MKPIKFNEPFMTGQELKYIQDVFEQKHFYGNGKYTKLCADFIKTRLAVKNVLITDSCTSALEIVALLLRNKDVNQEVILPSYTFSSTASAFARAGFKLVFAEVDDKTMMLDVNDVKKKITGNTTAIVVVHYGGHCADIKAFKNICDDNDIKLVEDAAQAFDCFLDDTAIGTFGDFGCFSFHETKNLHAGLSGALVVKDDTIINRATHIWERGTNRQEVLKGLANKYSWVEIGGSFYPTELQTAFLYAQLTHIEHNRVKRQEIHNEYFANLSILRSDDLLSFPDFPVGFKSNYHAFYVLFNTEEECDVVREYLNEKFIAAYIGYVPLHSSPVGKSMGYLEDSLPITEQMSKRVLRLPLHNNMEISDVKRVSEIVGESINA